MPSNGPRPDPDRFPASRSAQILERLLVAAGGSEFSLSALKMALHLATAAAGEVEALIVDDVYLPPGAMFAHGETLATLMRQAEQVAAHASNEVEARVKRIADEHAVSVAIRRESGRVADVLVQSSPAASMILLGRRGCRSEHGGLLGSNAELVVRRTEKPVLLAPERFRVPSRIVVAYGGKDMGAHALSMAVQLQHALRIPLTVLSVADSDRRRAETWQRARALQPELESGALFDHDEGDVAAGILRRATVETVLVMGAYGHSRLYRMVIGSVTEQVMRSAKGPLLISRK